MSDYPRLAASCSFHAYDNGGGGGEEYVLATADGRQFKISRLARDILGRLDGKTSIAGIAAQLNASAVPISPDQLRALLEQKYAPLGVIEDGTAPPGPETRVRVVRRIGFPMLVACNVVPQRLVAWASARLAFLYSPWAVLPLLVLIAWAHGAVYRGALQALTLTPESYLRITAYCLLSILFHELGHAAALSRFGGTPGAIGFGLYLLLPTFYADVSQLWRFPRRHRMVVDLGGAWFQQIAFAAFALAAVRIGDAELLATCRLIDVMVLTALNPLFLFDGYWLLADYLAIPRLQRTAFQYLGWRARRLASRPAEPPKLPPLHRAARALFHSYSLLAGFFLAATFWLVYRHLSTTLLRLPAVLSQASRMAAAAFAHGDAALFVTRSMALFFLAAFPATALLGLILYLRRLLHFCAGRLARRAGRAHRGLPQGG